MSFSSRGESSEYFDRPDDGYEGSTNGPDVEFDFTSDAHPGDGDAEGMYMEPGEMACDLTAPTETGPTLAAPDFAPVVTDIVSRAVADRWVETAYGADQIAALIEEARAGNEVEVPLISGIWTPESTSERRRLERRFSNSWAYSVDGWQEMMLELGVPLPGTRTEDLRDATGRIRDVGFIATLLRTSQAVEIGQRPDDNGGSIAVNHAWRLWRQGGGHDAPYLPLATVRTVDRDAATAVRYTRSRPTSQIALHATRGIAVGEKLVILSGLAIPIPRQAEQE
jgi:hypothetical protein